MSEKKITSQVRELLIILKRNYRPHIFSWKVADKFTSSIPDYYVLIHGTPIHIELKDVGEVPRPLQERTIHEINQARGIAISTDRFKDVENLLMKVIKHHGLKKRPDRPGGRVSI